MRLEFTCTRCLTTFAASRNGREAAVARCPGCGGLCRDPIDRQEGTRVRQEAGVLVIEPVGTVPIARFRCNDCGGELTARTDAPGAAVYPMCGSGRTTQVSPAATGIGLGTSQPLTRTERKRHRFITRWHGNYEALRQRGAAFVEAMGPLEFDEAAIAEVRELVARLVTEAERIKEGKIERYLERLSGHGV